MNNLLLREILEVMCMLQEEFHSKVDDSVARRLNELIEEIQNAISENSKISSKDLLEKIGLFLELISSIKSIIDFLK